MPKTGRSNESENQKGKTDSSLKRTPARSYARLGPSGPTAQTPLGYIRETSALFKAHPGRTSMGERETRPEGRLGGARTRTRHFG